MSDPGEPGDPPAPPAPPETPGTPASNLPKPKDPGVYMPLIVITCIFATVFIVVPLFFRKGPNKGIVKCSIMIAAFSMWLFWVTVYIAQMNPLLGPRLKNTTLAWISHSWGNKRPSAPGPETLVGDSPGLGPEAPMAAPPNPQSGRQSAPQSTEKTPPPYSNPPDFVHRPKV